MKIAILSYLFPPMWLAGAEIAAYNMAKYLAKRGHEVHVITSLDGGLLKKSTEQGFYVHRVRCPRIKYLGIPSFWLAALPCLREINPDMVHIQGIQIGMCGFLSKKFLKKNYVIWRQGYGMYLPWLFKNQILNLVLRNANAVIALTEDMKGKMEKACNKDAYVIPNGVNLEGFENLSQKKARTKLHIKEGEKVIIFVGTLRPVKGVKYLLQAIYSIKQKDMEVRLMLVGDGEERKHLEELVKELDLKTTVRFAGKVPNEKVPQYMAASDIFVLPSLSEGFPLAILEAMATGLPIITTNVRALPEIVKNGENGLLVEPGNSEELAEKISLLLKNKELRRRISINNREKVKNYSWEAIVERLERVYYNMGIPENGYQKN